MSTIIEEIEKEQIGAAPNFSTGDTVKVYGRSRKVTRREFRFSKVLY